MARVVVGSAHSIDSIGSRQSDSVEMHDQDLAEPAELSSGVSALAQKMGSMMGIDLGARQAQQPASGKPARKVAKGTQGAPPSSIAGKVKGGKDGAKAKVKPNKGTVNKSALATVIENIDKGKTLWSSSIKLTTSQHSRLWM